VRAIRSQVDVLSEVTEGYLRFARLPKPRLDVVSLAPVIADLADFVREELRARKVQLLVNVEPELPAGRADAGQIRQALLNLIRNAAEAMPEGGTVTFAARCVRDEGRLGSWATGQLGDPTTRALDNSTNGQLGSEIRSNESGRFPESQAAQPPSRPAAAWVEIIVTDTGVGVAQEDLERVFEPFYTSKQGGTGLGLAISREIAVEHGGTLVCESIIGHGATFRLTLPAAEEGRAR